MRGLPACYKGAIFQLPRIRMINGRFPAIETFSIAQSRKARFDLRTGQPRGKANQRAGRNSQEQISFHSPQIKRANIVRKQKAKSQDYESSIISTYIARSNIF